MSIYFILLSLVGIGAAVLAVRIVWVDDYAGGTER